MTISRLLSSAETTAFSNTLAALRATLAIEGGVLRFEEVEAAARTLLTDFALANGAYGVARIGGND